MPLPVAPFWQFERVPSREGGGRGRFCTYTIRPTEIGVWSICHEILAIVLVKGLGFWYYNNIIIISKPPPTRQFKVQVVDPGIMQPRLGRF